MMSHIMCIVPSGLQEFLSCLNNVFSLLRELNWMRQFKAIEWQRVLLTSLTINQSKTNSVFISNVPLTLYGLKYALHYLIT